MKMQNYPDKLHDRDLKDRAFVRACEIELAKARTKFPSSILSMTALTEEVGELAQALLKHAAGKGTLADVFAEAVQVAVMAQRVTVEGDASITAAKYIEP